MPMTAFDVASLNLIKKGGNGNIVPGVSKQFVQILGE